MIVNTRRWKAVSVCCSTRRRKPGNRAVLNGEVDVPVVQPRVEQACLLLGQWIEAHQARALLTLASPIFESEIGNLFKVNRVSCEEREVVRPGNRRNSQIHRADADALLAEIVELNDGGFVEWQNFELIVVEHCRFYQPVTTRHCVWRLRARNRVMGTEQLFVNAYDRYVKSASSYCFIRSHNRLDSGCEFHCRMIR